MRKKMGYFPLFLTLMCSGILACTSTIAAQDMWSHQNSSILANLPSGTAVTDDSPVFILENLTIQPGVNLFVGDSPTLHMDIRNTGDEGGNATVFLYMDEEICHECNSTVWVNATETNHVTLVVPPLLAPGVFEISVGLTTLGPDVIPLTVTVRSPPVFTYSDLTVSPREIFVGESVNLQVNVTNGGNIGGPVTTCVYLNDTRQEGYTVTEFLQPQETKRVELTGITLTIRGVFGVSVGNLTMADPEVTPVIVTVLNPPMFTYSNLTVTPLKILVGEPGNLQVNVTNEGDIGGNLTVFLYVNNTIHHEDNVTIWVDVSETKTIDLPVQPIMTPGIYGITVGNQTEPDPDLSPVSLEVYDNAPPVISAISILCPSKIPGAWVNISFMVTDDVKVQDVYLNVTLPNNTVKAYSLINNITSTKRYYLNQTYPDPGLYTFSIWSQDSSGNTNIPVVTHFWIYEAIVQKLVTSGLNTINVTAEMNLLLTCNATSNTTLTLSRYPDNPHFNISHQVGLLPVFFDIEIDNPDAIQWPITLTIYFTDSDLVNTDMNTSQLLGLFCWNETLWTLLDDTGINPTEYDGYRGSLWGNIYNPCTVAAGGDINPPDTEISDGPTGPINYTDVIFKWRGDDDFTNSSNLTFSYRLDGYSPASWSEWTTATTQVYNDLPNGNYTFSIKAKDQSGNIDPTPASRSFTITRPPNQHPQAIFSWHPDSPSDLETVTFIDSSLDPDGAILNWTWNLGDGTIVYGKNISHNYPIDGTYIISLTVRDNDNATNTTKRTINIRNVYPVADFTYSIDGRLLTFTDTSIDLDGTITSWYWDFGDQNYSVASNPTHEYGEEGDYTVSLTVWDDDQDSHTYSTQITVKGEDEGIPGFELVALLGALAIIFLWRRKT